jgi:hypothetical protein
MCGRKIKLELLLLLYSKHVELVSVVSKQNGLKTITRARDEQDCALPTQNCRFALKSFYYLETSFFVNLVNI